MWRCLRHRSDHSVARGFERVDAEPRRLTARQLILSRSGGGAVGCFSSSASRELTAVSRRSTRPDKELIDDFAVSSARVSGTGCRLDRPEPARGGGPYIASADALVISPHGSSGATSGARIGERATPQCPEPAKRRATAPRIGTRGVDGWRLCAQVAPMSSAVGAGGEPSLKRSGSWACGHGRGYALQARCLSPGSAIEPVERGQLIRPLRDAPSPAAIRWPERPYIAAGLIDRADPIAPQRSQRTGHRHKRDENRSGAGREKRREWMVCATAGRMHVGEIECVGGRASYSARLSTANPRLLSASAAGPPATMSLRHRSSRTLLPIEPSAASRTRSSAFRRRSPPS